MILSILIPTIPDRAEKLARLLAVLRPQLVPGVEILIGRDEGERTIGQKRNELLAAAAGDFVCFIDDDDLVPPDYIARILKALESRPDVVGFRAPRYINGTLRGEAIHSTRYTEDRNVATPGGERYERMPNHLNPIRRELALAVGFKPTNQGEDTDFAKRLRPLLDPAKEAFIDAAMYEYWYVSPAHRRHERTNKSRAGQRSNRYRTPRPARNV